MKDPAPAMNRLLLATLSSALLAGCRSAEPDATSRGTREAWVGAAIQGAAIRRAIISQHTLYPYHFGAGSVELNDLGRRDLAVLAEHCLENPCEINLHRGDASAELYAGRTSTLLAALAEAGVDDGRVSVVDGPPGGAGISGTRVLKLLEAESAAADHSIDTTGDGR